jgi:hypothetical protein
MMTLDVQNAEHRVFMHHYQPQSELHLGIPASVGHRADQPGQVGRIASCRLRNLLTGQNR